MCEFLRGPVQLICYSLYLSLHVFARKVVKSSLLYGGKRGTWHVKGILKDVAGKGCDSLPQPTHLVLLSVWVHFPFCLEDRNVLNYRSLENHFVRDSCMQTALFACNIERTIEVLTL